jgi:peroxiredoxin
VKLNKKYYRWIAEISLILIIITAARLWMQRDIVSGVAPNITATTLSGHSFDLHQYQKKPILVYFWASWCPVCKLEQSNIQNISEEYPVITIAMQSGNDDEVKQFMKEENLTFKVINDEFGIISKKYNIKGVPVSFVVNKDNKINFVEVGYTTEPGLRLRMWWAGL